MRGAVKASDQFPHRLRRAVRAARPSYRLQRGEPLQRREQVTPGAIPGIGTSLSMPAEAREQERRLALARWIVDPIQPTPSPRLGEPALAAPLWPRACVHAERFRPMGGRPTHPELLDWLASELIGHAGASSTSSGDRPLQHLSSVQPVQSGRAGRRCGNRWLWRFPPQRLPAEPIRDAILAVSGNLDLRMGGRGFDLFRSPTATM